MLNTNFWQDKSSSQKIIKEKQLFEDLVNSYDDSLNKISDLDELNKLALEENNLEVQKEVFENTKKLRKSVKKK